MVADLISWAQETLKLPPDALQNTIDVVVQTPWSCVLKIRTSEGVVYLKQTPPALFIEADVLSFCHSLCQFNSMPRVVGQDKKLHCFLMTDCGDHTLRTHFKGQFQADLWVKSLEIYRACQQATAPYIDEFIRIGVPDWRLEHYPALFTELVSDPSFLAEEGLSASDIEALGQLGPRLQMQCDQLAAYPLPACLNHADFHDNNVVMSERTGAVSLIDMGETSVEYPLFSLLASLDRVAYRYQLDTMSADYQACFAASFNGWFQSDNSLTEALTLTRRLLPLWWLLAHRRLMLASDPLAFANTERMTGRLKTHFKSLLNNFSDS